MTYFAEYSAFIVVLAWISQALTVTYNLGVSGYLLVGTISALYLVLSGLIAIPMGHLTDKFGRRALSLTGCLLGCASMLTLLAVGGSGSLTGFLVGVAFSLTFLGLGHGTYTSSTLAYVGDVSESADMGKSYGIIEDAEFASYVFGPGAGGVIAVLVGREQTFVVSAVIFLLAAAIASKSMSGSPQSMGGSVRPDMMAMGGVESSKAVQPETNQGVSWAAYFGVLKDSTVAVTIGTTVAVSLAFTSYLLYVSVYAQDLSSVSLVRDIGAASGTIMATTCILTMIPIGLYEDRSGRRMILLVVGMVLGSLALALVFSNPSVWTFLGSSLIFGTALAMARISQYVILSERSNDSTRAAIMGTNHAFEHAGYGLGALAGGVMTAVLGDAATFRYLAVALLLSALFFFFYASSRKMK